MKCPVCKTDDLLMTERQGIEIDYCGTCRGVWLDRGELDKLLTRACEEPVAASAGRPPVEHARHDDRDRRADWRHGDHSRDDYQTNRGPYRKKKSFLGELFDFD